MLGLDLHANVGVAQTWFDIDRGRAVKSNMSSDNEQLDGRTARGGAA